MKKELKIGITGVVALVVLFLGIRFLKGANLFSSTNELILIPINTYILIKG